MAKKISTKAPQTVVALENKQKRGISVSTLVIAVLVTLWVGYIVGTRFPNLTNLLSGKSPSSSLDFSSLNSLYNTLGLKFDGKVDASKILDGTKHGLVEAAGDPYTVYFNAEEAKSFNSDLSGQFEGIGAELAKVNGQLTIMSVIKDSPAEKAGLKAKDIIVKVDDQDTSSMTVGAAVTKIRGTAGTTVKLNIARPDEIKDYTITRDKITSPSVKWEMKQPGVGLITISRFGDDTSKLSLQAANELKDQGASKIILDLRGDGGGLLTAAQDVASLWLQSKTIVSERSNDGKTEKDVLYSGVSAPLYNIPTIVLVDGGSASASEIVAGALKDNGAATLLGVKTFGKGSVQEMIDLPDGGILKVTVAKWYTPNGKNINKEGITPDKNVEMSDDDVKAGRDPQMDAALTDIAAMQPKEQ